MSEILISIVSSTIILLMAYGARRSVLFIAIAAYAIFGTMLFFLKYLIGSSIEGLSDLILVESYGAFVLFTFGIFLFVFISNNKNTFQVKKFIKEKSGNITLAITFYILLWIFRIYLAAKYEVNFSGSISTEKITLIPYQLIILNSLLSLLGMGSLILIISQNIKNNNKLFILLIAVEILWSYVTDGRRGALFFTSFVGIYLYMIGYIKLRYIALTSVAVILFVYFTTPIFLTIRLNNQINLAAGSDGIQALVNASVDAFSECGELGKCNDLITQNLNDRGNVLEFMKELVNTRRSLNFPLLHGDAFANMVAWSVPSIFIEKPGYMVEQFIQSKYSMVIGDDSISIPLVAYADFGLLGCFISGFIFSIYCVGIINFGVKQNAIIAFGLLYSLFKMLWNVELDPTSLIVLLRDIFLLYLIFRILGFFLNKSSIQRI